MIERRDVRAQLERVLHGGLDAVHGERATARVLDRAGDAGQVLRVAGSVIEPNASVVIVAVGKAAAPMARAAERWAGDRFRAGLVITKDGHAEALGRCHFRECQHPIPDERGEAAAREALDLVSGVAPDDLLLVLLSGGASALTTCPPSGLSLGDLAATTRTLLHCGAPIDEINCIRKHLSDFAGGRLAEAATARRIEVLAISDVPGDVVDLIGSGPCASDDTTFRQSLSILEMRGVAEEIPIAVRRYLERGLRGEVRESAKPGSPAIERVRTTLVARSRDAVEAAAQSAQRAGLRPIRLDGFLRGEARDAGRRLAALAGSVQSRESVCLIASGETTVTVRGDGLGGRNQELALAAAKALEGAPGVALLAAGTDGTDGPTEAAGAFVDSQTAARAQRLGLRPDAFLERNDAYHFFEQEGGLLEIGPTSTNVMDLALVRVEGRGGRVTGG